MNVIVILMMTEVRAFWSSYHIPSFTKKAGRTLKRVSLNSAMITMSDEPKLNQNTRSSETLTEANPSSLPTSSGRLSNRSSASSMGLVGASHGSFFKQSRADELGVCSICNKKFPNLSKVGTSTLLCSVCRWVLYSSDDAIFDSLHIFAAPLRSHSFLYIGCPEGCLCRLEIVTSHVN